MGCDNWSDMGMRKKIPKEMWWILTAAKKQLIFSCIKKKKKDCEIILKKQRPYSASSFTVIKG